MSRLFYFFYRYRAFFLFFLLEFFSAWLIVQNNQYQGVHFLNFSNSVVVGGSNLIHIAREYFLLTDANKELAEENAALRTALEQRNQSLYLLDVREIKDPNIINHYNYTEAKVVNNSVYWAKNYITLNKGSDQGIEPDMAVISPKGVIGKVKSVSKHYAVVISLLNIDLRVSSVIKNTNHFGTIRWSGKNPQYSRLDYIPRHASPALGDTIVTSGFNSIFPEGVQIGFISGVELRDEAQFYNNIEVKLAPNFSSLSYVQIVRNKLKAEKDSLEYITTNISYE